jgi:hypothetical protein
MKKSLKSKAIYILVLLTLCGCSNPSTPATLPSIKQVKAPSANESNPITDQRSKPPKQDNRQDFKLKLAGSEISSQWIRSKDKAVSCRVKKWQAYRDKNSPYQWTDADLEFVNLASKKPVNIVYTIFAGDKNGEPMNIFTSSRKEQLMITEFQPPLKKNESRIDKLDLKYTKIHSLKLKGCRVALEGENYATVNPGILDGDDPRTIGDN